MFRAHASAEDPGPSAVPGEALPPEPSPERVQRGPKAEGKRVFDRAVQAERRERVANLLLQRMSEAEIARALGVNRSTICKDVRAIMLEWSRSRVGDYHALVVRELRSLDRDESRLRARLQTYEPPPGLALDPEIESLRLRLLDRILRIGERRAKILGLDSPDRLELTGRDGGPIEVTGGDVARLVLMDARASELASQLVDRLAALGPAMPSPEIEDAPTVDAGDTSTPTEVKEEA